MTITSTVLTRAVIEAFNPVRGARYSPNFYAFLRGREHQALAGRAQIYRGTDDQLWIGYWFDGSFIGARMPRVLRIGPATTLGSFSSIEALSLVEDFWDRYAAVGRCAIDVSHVQSFVGDDTRWLVRGDTRTCQWCHAVTQHRHRWVETIERESWRNEG